MRRLCGLLRALRPTMLFTAIPFALLVNSSSVHMSLQVERDGSARRLISVETSPYFRGQVAKWVGDVQAGRPWDRTWRRDSGTTYSYARDYRTQTLNSQSVNGHLETDDVFQNPLSVFTTYTWQEEVSFGYLYDSDRTAAQAAETQLVYEVVMPGQVTDATVRESKPSSDKPAAGLGACAPAPRPHAVVAPLFTSPAEAQEMPAAGAPAAAQPPAPAAGAAPAAPVPAAAPEAAPAAPGATPPAPSTGTPPTPTPAVETPGATPPAADGATPPPAPEAGPAPAVTPEGKRSSVDFSGRTATFKLMASQPTLTINVTARRVRWGYLVIVAYVLAFVVTQLCQGLKRAASLRPRKI
ncbi:hypothetical protein LLH23_18350 [bacterium]|nr:hypothetical protein [bacterium]